MTILDKLKELSAKAMQGKWECETGRDYYPNGEVRVEFARGPYAHENCQAEKDAELVTAMRNNIDKLIAVAEAAKKIKHTDEMCSFDVVFNGRSCRCGYDELRKALEGLGEA